MLNLSPRTSALSAKRRWPGLLLVLLCAAGPLAAQPADTARKDIKAPSVPVQGAGAPMQFPAAGGAPRMESGINPAAKGFAGMRLMSGMGGLGATVGGAQDIGYARRLIESGNIPSFIDFSPEGLYSEHDIPTPAGICDQKLCLSLGYGFAPTADNGSNALFVQLGLASNIQSDRFKRARLQLALVIDKSGSMQGASMEAVKSALRSLLDRLTEDDEILLVQFNTSATLLLPPTRVTDRVTIERAIAALEAGGGTDIEAGLDLGFRQLDSLPARNGASKRLMLFTDAMPNSGRTDTASFRKLTEGYANRGIGLTAFGVGVNFGQELIYHITQIRGGNFFFLETPEKIAKVFDQDFEYLVTPLVYDLNVRIATPNGLKLTAVYGLPGWKPGDRDALLHIPTVFLSSNRGAIILRYERDGAGSIAMRQGDLVADGSLDYTDVDGSHHATSTEIRHNGVTLEPGTQFFTHDGMRMAVALTNVYFGLRDACTLYTQGKKPEALAMLDRAAGVARLENLALHDAGVDREIALLDTLAGNMAREGATRERSQGAPDAPVIDRPRGIPERLPQP